jgi:hypothetical protein
MNTCPQCNSNMIFKSDVSKKTGKPWSGDKCVNPACGLMVFHKTFEPKPAFQQKPAFIAPPVAPVAPAVQTTDIVIAIDKLNETLGRVMDSMVESQRHIFKKVDESEKNIMKMFNDCFGPKREPGQDG